MNELRIFFIGDVVGKPGIDFLSMWLPQLLQKYKPDLVIANAENAADGKGITQKDGDTLFGLGIHVLTGGNHTWDKHNTQDYLKAEARVLRPLNYPRGTTGKGFTVVQTKKGKAAVVNLQGRTFMAAIDCPFRSAEWAAAQVRSETKVIFVDFHAEATAEKIALAHFMDGKVSFIAGTHTHVQTSDARIFPNGTGYITDTGMTGPYDSVIGMKKQPAINRFLYQTPQRFELAADEVHLSALSVSVDADTGKTISIETIFFPEFLTDTVNYAANEQILRKGIDASN